MLDVEEYLNLKCPVCQNKMLLVEYDRVNHVQVVCYNCCVVVHITHED